MSEFDAKSEVTGSVWKILVSPGDSVSEDEPLMILESMKMEIPLMAPGDGTVKSIRFKEGEAINAGDVAVILED